MTGQSFRRLTAAMVVAGGLSAAVAQTPGDPYIPVPPVALAFDRDGVWTMNFAYLPPRIVQVDVPGRGKQTVWYMVYQVWNTSDTPHTIIPTFELVTKDGRLQSFLDSPEPAVADQIRAIEDPTGVYDLKTTISISKTPIPVTRALSLPRKVHGVAVWPTVSEQAGDVNAFSVYVTGLSNGLAAVQKDGQLEEVRRKTLQLDFIRPTDNVRPMLGDIRPNDNGGLGAEKWIYRVAPVAKTGDPKQ